MFLYLRISSHFEDSDRKVSAPIACGESCGTNSWQLQSTALLEGPSRNFESSSLSLQERVVKVCKFISIIPGKDLYRLYSSVHSHKYLMSLVDLWMEVYEQSMYLSDSWVVVHKHCSFWGIISASSRPIYVPFEFKSASPWAVDVSFWFVTISEWAIYAFLGFIAVSEWAVGVSSGFIAVSPWAVDVSFRSTVRVHEELMYLCLAWSAQAHEKIQSLRHPSLLVQDQLTNLSNAAAQVYGQSKYLSFAAACAHVAHIRRCSEGK